MSTTDGRGRRLRFAAGLAFSSPLIAASAWGGIATIAAVLATVLPAALPPVPMPPQNPVTEAKRVLGKMLFWDEQLSSDNVTACATCHNPSRAGGDARRTRNAGSDALFNTPDDVFASPGVIREAADKTYKKDNVYGFGVQVTGRSAPSVINAAYAPELFWDGRAHGNFINPQTGATSIPNGGALESQSVNPPVGDAEMAHESRNWGQITTKLAAARPLALASALPTDVVNALAGEPTYPTLFQRAFGDANITAERIAFAIASYERTLIADQTPWDRFQAGDNTALTPGQQAGLNTFNQGRCNVCHVPPLFTDQTFRNIGLRPNTEDLGRQNVTANNNDRGKFKVPSLRNVGLMTNFMHNGEFTDLTSVVQFYTRVPGAPQQFQDNIDPVMGQVRFPPQQDPAIVDFLANGLLDSRVANQTFPFDHPTLYDGRAADHPALITPATPGAGGFVPQIIAITPPMIGNPDFKIGVSGGLGGAAARLVASNTGPVNGRINADAVIEAKSLSGTGSGSGFTTVFWPIGQSSSLSGRTIYVQWQVTDAAATGGAALSAVARITFFCPRGGCSDPCPADLDDGSGLGLPDGGVTIDDLLYYLSAFAAGDVRADVDDGSGTGLRDGGVTIDDLLYYLLKFSIGC